MIVEAADPCRNGRRRNRASFDETLRQRAATLDAIAEGFGHPGFAGKWVNTFGSVTVTPADGGTFRLASDTSAVYGTGSDRRRTCKVRALVKPSSGAWLTGAMLPDEAAKRDRRQDRPAIPNPSRNPGKNAPPGRDAAHRARGRRMARRRTSRLRIYVAAHRELLCRRQAEAVADKADTTFVPPTFDCTRPETASDEEICADPDMAANDQKLNKVWKALLPRLDDTTRRALTDDQRNWVKAQASQYPEFLHPAWNKTTSQMHYTADARDKLERLQRERIALIEGFDDKRVGLAGTWLAYNAVIEVTADKNGSITTKGWKWDQGDWKAGCDYEMNGKLVRGAFRSDENRKNPDTLERDHATLIVNRLDDVFSRKRRRTAPRTRRLTSRNASAMCQIHRPRGCSPPAPRPTSTIWVARSADARVQRLTTPATAREYRENRRTHSARRSA